MVAVVLNVAEKPSVARSLQTVFGRTPGAQSRGMQRDGSTQIFTHEGVQFPSIHQQGQGGPEQQRGGGIPGTYNTEHVHSSAGMLYCLQNGKLVERRE